MSYRDIRRPPPGRYGVEARKIREDRDTDRLPPQPAKRQKRDK